MTNNEKRKAKAIAHAKALDFEDLDEAIAEGVIDAADGCRVELDGVCPHGYPSPLRLLGII